MNYDPAETGPDYEQMILRAADEGVPIAALKRIFKPQEDRELRELLSVAVMSGRLAENPREDWPIGQPRAQRTPTVAPHVLREDGNQLIVDMARNMKITKQEGHILLVLVRRGNATREQLHDAVEACRGNPDEATNIKIVDVVICKLRKKLAVFGINLHTIHSIGYEMTEADRRKVIDIARGAVT
jgi:DNA-binding response OmpR family regulator